MSSPDSEWGPLVAAIAVIALPVVIRTIASRVAAFRQRGNPPENQTGPLGPQQTKPRHTSTSMKLTVAIYSLLALAFWYTSQPDLFTRLRLPITANGDKIRSALITQRPIEFIPLELQRAYHPGAARGLDRRDTRTSHPLFTPELDRVLQRIETFDIRMIYGRLGHSVVASCDWCTTHDDYLVFAAAGLSLGYVALFCIIGIVTEAPERRKSRTYAVLFALLAAAADVFFTGFVKGVIRKGDTVQYYTRAQLCRLVLHLTLPTFLLLLPHNAPYLTQEIFMNTVQALAALSHVSNAQQSTIKNTRYAGLVREASLHSWAEATSRKVDAALEDDEFRSALDQARPADGEQATGPAVERLKAWAGRAVGEVLRDVNGIITGSGVQPAAQG